MTSTSRAREPKKDGWIAAKLSPREQMGDHDISPQTDSFDAKKFPTIVRETMYVPQNLDVTENAVLGLRKTPRGALGQTTAMADG